MSPDHIDSLAVMVHDIILAHGFDIDENDDFLAVQNFLYKLLDSHLTKQRNYN